jgi:hypothetical protein
MAILPSETPPVFPFRAEREALVDGFGFLLMARQNVGEFRVFFFLNIQKNEVPNFGS